MAGAAALSARSARQQRWVVVDSMQLRPKRIVPPPAGAAQRLHSTLPDDLPSARQRLREHLWSDRTKDRKHRSTDVKFRIERRIRRSSPSVASARCQVGDEAGGGRVRHDVLVGVRDARRRRRRGVTLRPGGAPARREQGVQEDPRPFREALRRLVRAEAQQALEDRVEVPVCA